MHYYQFYIADYRKDTSHLSRLEHSIYRDLIDWYYLDESPISKDMAFISRRLKLSTKSEIEAFHNVIQDFFTEDDNGYRHKKIDEEICEYHKKCEVNSANGKKGGRPKGKITQTVSERLANAMPTDSETEPNQKAISNQYSVISKHETVNNIHIKDIEAKASKAKSTRLPSDWELPDEWAIWCKENRRDLNPNQVAEQFKDYWLSVPHSKGLKADWLATWRNWCRNQKVSTQDKTYESPWQKADRLRMQELAPGVATRAHDDEMQTIDEAFNAYKRPQRISHDITN